MSKKNNQQYFDVIADHVRTCGYSQKALSDKLHMSPSTINSLAQAERDPKLGTVIALADLLGLSLDQITGYTIPIPPIEEDELYESETINRIEASLVHLHRSLSEIANFKQSDDTTEIVTYVQECLQQILNGQKLKGELEISK